MPRIAVTVAEQKVIQAIRGTNAVTLTPREEQMVSLLKAGVGTHKKLATAMSISEGTSRVYAERVYLKLRGGGYAVDSMVDLLAWAFARDGGALETYRRITPETLHAPTVINAR